MDSQVGGQADPQVSYTLPFVQVGVGSVATGSAVEEKILMAEF